MERYRIWLLPFALAAGASLSGTPSAHAGDWKNRNYDPGTFPYSYALLSHHNDEVKFQVTNDNDGFYYVTWNGAPGRVEIYVNGQSKGIKTLTHNTTGPVDLPSTEGGTTWGWYSLSSYVGKTVKIVVREHQVFRNWLGQVTGRWGDADICIKLKDNQAATWKGVDSSTGQKKCCPRPPGCAVSNTTIPPYWVCPGEQHTVTCDLGA